MLFHDFFARRHPRQFSFTTYYYQPAEEVDEQGPRIKFRRIRKNARTSKASTKNLTVLVLFFSFCLYYLWNLVEPNTQTFELENIRIEVAPSGM